MRNTDFSAFESECKYSHNYNIHMYIHIHNVLSGFSIRGGRGHTGSCMPLLKFCLSLKSFLDEDLTVLLNTVFFMVTTLTNLYRIHTCKLLYLLLFCESIVLCNTVCVQSHLYMPSAELIMHQEQSPCLCTAVIV